MEPPHRPRRKQPAYPTLVAYLISATGVSACKSHSAEPTAGEMQSAHGLDAGATGQGGHGGAMHIGVPPNIGATAGIPPATREPNARRSPHQVMPGGKSPPREPDLRNPKNWIE